MNCKCVKKNKIKKVVTTVEIFREDGSLETNKSETPNKDNSNEDTSAPSKDENSDNDGNGVDL